MITIHALKEKQVFIRDTIYFRFATQLGCKALLKVSFPNEDKRDDWLERKNDPNRPYTQFELKEKLRAMVQDETDKLWINFNEVPAYMKKLDNMIQ